MCGMIYNSSPGKCLKDNSPLSRDLKASIPSFRVFWDFFNTTRYPHIHGDKTIHIHLLNYRNVAFKLSRKRLVTVNAIFFTSRLDYPS